MEMLNLKNGNRKSEIIIIIQTMIKNYLKIAWRNLLMLSKHFLKLVLISVLIAFPLAWWAMNQWLQSFAYRSNIGTEVFMIAGASILLITLFTISFKTIKAAIANPVNSLGAE